MTLSRARALGVLGIMALVAIIAVAWTITRDHHGSSAAGKQACTATAVITKIPQPDEVQLRILNATNKPGLATAIANQFKARGFSVLEVGNSSDVPAGTAEVRFGPKAVGAAHLVRAQIPQAQPIADNRKDDVVVLVLGPELVELTPKASVSSTVKALGEPVRPKPTCEKNS